jgi:hypothetical protein
MMDSGGHLLSSLKEKSCGVLVERKDGGGRCGPLPPACLNSTSPTGNANSEEIL